MLNVASYRLGSGGGGGSQTLAQTLANGNSGNSLEITNIADGTAPQSAATVAQLDAAIEANNLQQVTDNGNETTNNIFVFNNPDGGTIGIQSSGSNASASISVQPADSSGALFLSNSNFSVQLEAQNMTDVRTQELPDGNGVLVLSVNGEVADNAGNVVTSSSLTATQIGYGDGSNLLTGDANHTIDPITGLLTIQGAVNFSGFTGLNIINNSTVVGTSNFSVTQIDNGVQTGQLNFQAQVSKNQIQSDNDFELGSTNGKLIIHTFNGVINIENMPSYDNDTAAGGAGLVAGDLYQTNGGDITVAGGTIGIVMIKQ